MHEELFNILFSKKSEKETFLQARATENYLRSIGKGHLFQEAKFRTEFLENYDIPLKIRLALFARNLVKMNYCKTCDKVLMKLDGTKWKKYCSASCVQNDPEVKQRMLEGQKEVDWDKMIERRNKTMIEKYGVVSVSQTEEGKEAIREGSHKHWSDPEKKKETNQKREEAFLEKYGVEHNSKIVEVVEKRKKNRKKNRLVSIEKLLRKK